LKRAALGIALATLAGTSLISVASAQRRPGPGTANPSALIAAEIAFNRLARQEGQWTAHRETAADSAVMFVPAPVRAKDWLEGRDDPPSPVQWQPHQVWMSCDGTLGVTKGAWQAADGTTGAFTTIWQRQKRGEYRWILGQRTPLPEPMEQPLMISASVADCPGLGSWPGTRQTPDKDRGGNRQSAGPVAMDGKGASDDGTLTWSYHVAANLARTVSVSLRKDGQMKPVLALDVAAERPAN
jgi:hypothetical protein